MEIISRSEALKKGLKTYFTGKPCPYGHLTERRLTSSRCPICARDQKRRNKERYYAKQKEWLAANKDRVAEKQKERRARKLEADTKKQRERRAKMSPEKLEMRRAKMRDYYQRTRAQQIFRSYQRLEVVKQQTPKWADLGKMNEFYRNCPPGHEVDHIVPLQGREVRGLHVEANLQYLPRQQNRAKSNRLLEAA